MKSVTFSGYNGGNDFAVDDISLACMSKDDMTVTVCQPCIPAQISTSSYLLWGNSNLPVIPNNNNVFCEPWEDGAALYIKSNNLNNNLWYINDIPIPASGSYPNIGYISLLNNGSEVTLNPKGRYKFQVKNTNCGSLSTPTYVETIATYYNFTNIIGRYKPNYYTHLNAHHIMPLPGYGEHYIWNIPSVTLTNANILTSDVDIFFPQNIPLSGVNGTLTVSGSPFCNGVYSIRFDYDSHFKINEFSAKTSNIVSIYPNPTTSQIIISAKDSPIQLIEIYDVLGVPFKKLKGNNSKTISLNVSTLKSGVYNCKITTTNGIEYQKLMVQH
jgi:hypothetical protein